MKKKIAIIFGGCSTEYSVSLQSAFAVICNLDTDKYDPILIGITRQGDWFRYAGAVEKIKNDTWFAGESCIPAVISPSREVHGIFVFHKDKVEKIRIDAAFPIMHGKNGEDGTLQGLLELAGIPFVGCGTLCSALCMDKDLAHVVAQAAGVKVPAYVVVRKRDNLMRKVEEADRLGYPLFVKPAKAGSSFGITRVERKEQLPGALDIAFLHDNKVVIEQYIDGFEVGCAIMGNDELITGEVDEIELRQGFFDYNEKYTLETSKIHMPARISAQKAKEIKETAITLYRSLECAGFARVDMFLTPEGGIVFNEINTIPGFTSHSRYPSMLRGIGMHFGEIIDRLIGLVMENENDTAYK